MVVSTPAIFNAASQVLLISDTGIGCRESLNISRGSAKSLVGTAAILYMMAVTGHKGESGIIGRVTTFFCPAFCIVFGPFYDEACRVALKREVASAWTSILVVCLRDIGAI